jgi:hypothetical protein
MPRPTIGDVPSGRQDLTEPDLDAIAWRFLASAFAGPSYASWPVERRVDAYLSHVGMRQLFNDGDAYGAVPKRILTNVDPALRRGVLANTRWLTTVGIAGKTGAVRPTTHHALISRNHLRA